MFPLERGAAILLTRMFRTLQQSEGPAADCCSVQHLRSAEGRSD
ncbi:hypothetical protein BVRB_019130, partial [Beta vulgaris subsp. vulgaris]